MKYKSKLILLLIINLILFPYLSPQSYSQLVGDNIMTGTNNSVNLEKKISDYEKFVYYLEPSSYSDPVTRTGIKPFLFKIYSFGTSTYLTSSAVSTSSLYSISRYHYSLNAGTKYVPKVRFPVPASGIANFKMYIQFTTTVSSSINFDFDIIKFANGALTDMGYTISIVSFPISSASINPYTLSISFTVTTTTISINGGTGNNLPKIYMIGFQANQQINLLGIAITILGNTNIDINFSTSSTLFKLLFSNSNNYCNSKYGLTCFACCSNAKNSSGTCLPEHINLASLTPTIGVPNLNIDVDPVREWEFTISFWYLNTFPSDFTSSVGKIIYKDFMSFAITYTGSNQAVYCIPMEYLNSIETLEDKNLFDSWSFSKKIESSKAREWLYVKCAFSLSKLQMYYLLHDNFLTEAGTVTTTPSTINLTQRIIYDKDNSSINYKGISKKFYKTTEKTKFILRNIYGKDHDFYIKNFNVLNVYMDSTVDYRFISYSAIKESLPYVLLIPFESNSETVNETIIEHISSSAVVSLGTSTTSACASLNFVRLPLLEKNFKFNDNTLTVLVPYSGSDISSTTVEGNVKLSCKGNFKNGNTCQASCPTNFFRQYKYISNTSSENYLCVNQCSNTNTCPSAVVRLGSLDSGFSCSNGFFNKDYMCFTNNDSNTKDSAIQFSGTMNFAGVKITLGQVLTEYTITVWFHPDLLLYSSSNPIHVNQSFYNNKVIFLTNAFSVKYGPTGFPLQFTSGAVTKTKTEAPTLTWTQLVIGVNNGNEVLFTTKNNFLSEKITTMSSMSIIYFCNIGYDTMCTGNWIDAYYSNLRIFKGVPYSDIINTNDYSSFSSSNLLVYFDFKPINLKYNTITPVNDLSPPTQVVVDYKSLYTNEDKLFLYNIGNKFSIQSYNTDYLTNIDAITSKTAYTTFTCSAECTKCFGSTVDECYECKPDYILDGSTCISIIDKIPEKYIYKHQPSYANDVEFNFSNIFSDTTNNQLTFFAFIKISYISQTGDRCLIELGTNFCIYYKMTDELSLRYNSVDLFVRTGFSSFIGNWIYLSVSTFKSTNPIYSSQISMNINGESLIYIPVTINNILIEKVVLKKNWSGYAHYLTLFKSFIINPYGFVKLKKNITSQTEFAFRNVEVKTLILRSPIENQCLSQSDIINIISSIAFECGINYNPYVDFSGITGTIQNFYVKPDKTRSNDATCCDHPTSNGCIRESCDLVSGIVMSESKYLLEACDFKKTYNRRIVYHSTNVKTVLCHPLIGINFNRYSSYQYSITPDSTGIFTIAFYFRPEQYNPSITPNNNIKFSIKWEDLLEISIERKYRSGTNDFIYEVTCKGMGSTRKNIMAFSNLERAPVNIGCSVNAILKKSIVFVKNTSPVLNEKYEINDYDMIDFTSTPKNLIFLDESTDNYGFTIVKDISILKCYDCNSGDAYDIFPGTEVDGIFKSTSGLLTSLSLTDRPGYIGNMAYTITQTDNIPLLLCTTTNQFETKYYLPSLVDCGKIYNTNLITNSIVFAQIPNMTKNYRYTFAAWIYIEDISSISDGFNIKLDNHFHIHIGKDSSNTSNVKTICFPYIPSTDLLTKTTTEIETYLSTSPDVNSFNSSKSNSSWSLYSCSVTGHEGKYYVNNGDIKYFTPNFQPTAVGTNVIHMKNLNSYHVTSTSSLSITNMYTITGNIGRIYIKQITILNDYIPKELYDKLIFFKDMKSLFSQAFYTDLIVFNTSFDDITFPGSTSATISYRSSSTSLTSSLTIVPTGTSSARYTKTSSVNPLDLCTKEKEKDPTGKATLDYYSLKNSDCIVIDASCSNADVFCLKKLPSLSYFYCSAAGQILNLSNLTCETGTISKFTPGSKFSYFNSNDYSSTSETACTNTSSMYKFYHQCIDKTKYTNMYFSYDYSFGNLMTTFDSSVLPTQNKYGFEVWFYINTPPNGNNELHYLIAHPHKFYINHTGTYTSSTILSLSYSSTTTKTVGTVNIKEWNHIYIRATGALTEVYLNFDKNPVSIDNVSLTGLVFCNSSPTCTFNGVDYTTIKWGNVWYKSFKLYKSGYSFEMIKKMKEYETDTSIYGYMSMYFDYQIQNLVYSSNKYSIHNKITDSSVPNFELIDYEANRSINLSSDFDQISINNLNGKTISNKIKSIIDIVTDTVSCNDVNCNRCFNSNVSQCYECKANYFLTEDNTCKYSSGKFFKSSDTTNIELNLNSINLSNHRKLTIGFFVKILDTKALDTSFNSLIDFNEDVSNKHEIVYSSNKQLKIRFNSKDALVKSTAIGFSCENKWNYLSFSIYRSGNIGFTKHDLQIQVNRLIETLEPGFDKGSESISLTKIKIKKDIIALFADISVYSSFIKGPIGLLFSSDSLLKGQYRVLYYQLSFSSNPQSRLNLSQSSCLLPSQISSGDITSVSCISDYNEYFDSSLTCSTVDRLLSSDNCPVCDATCVKSLNTTPGISCFSNLNPNTSKSCSCFSHRHSYLLSDDNQCRENDSINIGFLNTITTQVKGSQIPEMTMEFWVLYHSYINTNFYKVSLIWDKHVRLDLENVSNTEYRAKGIAHTDISNDSAYISTYPDVINYSSNILKSQWQHVRISVMYNQEGLNFYTAGNLEQKPNQVTQNFDETYLTVFNSPASYNVQFKIKMESGYNLNFGVVFIRELKLYSSHLFSFYDTRYVPMNGNGLLFLNHYVTFENLNYYDDSSDQSFISPNSPTKSVQLTDINLNLSFNINSLSLTDSDGILSLPLTSYTKFVKCQPSQIHNGSTCVSAPSPASTTCDIFYGDATGNKCIKCPTGKYLHSDNQCHSTCPVGYFNFDFNNFCRRCNSNCLTCNGFYDDDCLTCAVGRFLILKNAQSGKCVDRCEPHGRVGDDDRNTSPPIPKCVKCDNQCSNFNEYDNISFPVPSPNNEVIDNYTLSFWVFIENIDLLSSSNAFSIIYDEHIGVFIKKESNTKIKAFCFPQEYKNQMNNKINFNNEILPMMTSISNYLEYSIEYGSSTGKWSFITCAASLTLGEFYMNNLDVVKMKPYDSENRMRHKDLYTILPRLNAYTLEIQNTKDGSSRIYLKEITVMSDYFPKEAFSKGIYYKDLGFIKSTYTSIVFYSKVPLLIHYETNQNIPYFTPSSPNSSQSTTKLDKTYPSLSNIIDLNLCKENYKANSHLLTFINWTESSQCSQISSCPDGTFCVENNNEVINCNSGNFLDLSSFTCQSTQVTSKTKQPNGKLFQNFLCSSNALSNCPAPNYTSDTAFTCPADKTKLFYECIDSTKYTSESSSLYFSSVFSFNKIEYDISKIPSTANQLKEYFIEFWVYIDNLDYGNNSKNKYIDSNSKYFYFYAKPHSIYASYPNGISSNNIQFKYNLNSVDYPILQNRNIYEWIPIYISVSFSTTANKTIVKVFTNLNFSQPEVSFDTSAEIPLEKLIFCPHFNDDMTCSTTSIGKIKKWGFGSYKNIRIWGNKFYMTPYYFQRMSRMTGSVASLYYYISLNLSDLSKNANNLYVITDKVSNTEVSVFEKGTVNDNDYSKKFNFLLDNDYIVSNNKLEEYISSINENNVYSTESCSENCKRCFNSESCYDCNRGYNLIGDKCYKDKHNYFTTPDLSSSIAELKVGSISDLEKITITFTIRIKSNSPTAISNQIRHPVVYLNSNKNSYIAYEREDLDNKKRVSLIINQVEAFKTDFLYFDKWCHFGVSLLKKDGILHPQQLLFQVNTEMVSINPDFDVQQEIIFNYLGLNHQVFALYSELTIYKSFIVGTYGIDKSNSLYNFNIHKRMSLSSEVKGTCGGGNTSITNQNLVCTEDEFEIFLNKEISCDSNEKYVFYKGKTVDDMSCLDCNSKCLLAQVPKYISDKEEKVIESSCYSGNSDSQCSCFIDKVSYFQYKDNTCRKAESFNFLNVDQLNFPVKISENNEMTIEFWYHIGFYMKNQLDKTILSWDGHLHVEISKNSMNENVMTAKCVPFSQFNNDLSVKSPLGQNESVSFNFDVRKWVLIRCAINNKETLEKYYMFDDGYKVIEKVLPFYSNEDLNSYIKSSQITPDSQYFNTESFKYVNFNIINKVLDTPTSQKYKNLNFGYVYIRDMRLFNSYLLSNYRTFNNNLTNKKLKLKHVLHYFEFKNSIFDNEKTYEISSYIPIFYFNDLIDPVDDSTEDNRMKFELIQYKDLKGYNKLTYDIDTLRICGQDETYQNGNTCAKKSSSSKCEIENFSNSCVLCKDNKYLWDSACFNDCPVGYPDPDSMTCKECHVNCQKCNGALKTQCSSCQIGLYLYQTENMKKEVICTEDCNQYSLYNYPFGSTVKDKIKEAECVIGELNAEVTLENVNINKEVNPYNINTFEFKISNVRLFGLSTMNKAKKTDYMKVKDFNATISFDGIEKYNITSSRMNSSSPLTRLTQTSIPTENEQKYINALLKKDYLTRGGEYKIHVFVSYIEVHSILNKTTNKTTFLEKQYEYKQEFILKTSSKPKNARMLINPKIGISEKTMFSIQCLTDEKKDSNLLYRISYTLVSSSKKDSDSNKEFESKYEEMLPRYDDLEKNEKVINLKGINSAYTFSNQRLTSFSLDNLDDEFNIYQVKCFIKDVGLDDSLTSFISTIKVKKFTIQNYESTWSSIFKTEKINGNFELVYNDPNFLTANVKNNAMMINSFVSQKYNTCSQSQIDDLKAVCPELSNSNQNNLPTTNSNSNSNNNNNKFSNPDSVKSVQKLNCDELDKCVCNGGEALYSLVEKRFICRNCQKIVNDKEILKNIKFTQDCQQIDKQKIDKVVNDLIDTINSIREDKTKMIEEIISASNACSVLAEIVIKSNNDIDKATEKLIKIEDAFLKITEKYTVEKLYSTFVKESINIFSFALNGQIKSILEEENNLNSKDIIRLNTSLLANKNETELTQNNTNDTSTKKMRLLDEETLRNTRENKFLVFFKNRKEFLMRVIHIIIQKFDFDIFTYDQTEKSSQAKSNDKDINYAETDTSMIDDKGMIMFHILKLKNTKNADDLLKKSSSNKLPFVQIENCIQSSGLDRNGLSLVIIYYLSSPYMFNEKISSNQMNNILSVQLIDNSSGKVLSIEKCTNENVIKLYFPINNEYNIPQLSSNWKDIISLDENKLDLSANYFIEPFYINPNTGEILRLTQQQRLLVSYLPVNFTCSFIDEKNYVPDNTGIEYSSFNSTENFFECKSSHLTEFILKYNLRPTEVKTIDKTYYMNRFEIYRFSGNYMNFIFILYVISLILSSIIFTSFLLLSKSQKIDLLSIKKGIINSQIPYFINKNKVFSELEKDDKEYNKINSENKQSPPQGIQLKSDLDVNLYENKEVNRSESKQNSKAVSEDHSINNNNSVENDKKDMDDYTSPVKVGVTKEEKEKVSPTDEQSASQSKENALLVLNNNNSNKGSITQREEMSNIGSKKISENIQFVASMTGKGKGKHKESTNTNHEDVIYNKDVLNIESIEYSPVKLMKSSIVNSIQNTNNKLIGNFTIGNNLGLKNKEKSISYSAKLPELKVDSSFVEKSKESSQYYEFTSLEYFKYNLKNRHFLWGDVFSFPVSSTRKYRKIVLFLYYILINITIISLVFLKDKNIFVTSIIDDLVTIIKGLLLSILISNLFTLLYCMTYSFSYSKLRKLYNNIRSNEDIKLFNTYKKVNICIILDTIYVSLLVLLFIISFHIAFGYCAVYKSQEGSIILTFFLGFVLDMLLIEVLIEAFLTLLYSLRLKFTWCVYILYMFERVRNFKMLI